MTERIPTSPQGLSGDTDLADIAELQRHIGEHYPAADEAHLGGVALERAAQALANEIPDSEVLRGDKFETARYVTEILHRDETKRDIHGLIRPRFRIGGRTVVFRNRQEAVGFPGESVSVAGSELTPPLDLSLDEEMPDRRMEKVRRFKKASAYNSARALEKVDAPENILAVTNTPEGLLAAALSLDIPSERRRVLTDMLRTASAGDYANPGMADLIDGVLGAVTINDDSKALEYFDTDGYAVALAALCGDDAAQESLMRKREALRQCEEKRKEAVAQEAAAWGERLEREGVEPVPLDQLCLVHSTAYEVERDENGTVVLAPGGQKDSPHKFPRASLHFTLNSRVYAHAQAQAGWGERHSLIVAPLQKAIEASGQMPEVLDGVDTWFVCNPGQAIKLPEAVVIRPQSVGDSLLEESDGELKFLAKETYTENQRREVRSLLTQYGLADDYTIEGMSPADQLKEIALHRAMAHLGVPAAVRDIPSSDGHGMRDSRLARRIYRTAAELGLRSGTHFNHPESRQELEFNSFMHDASNYKKQYKYLPHTMPTRVGADGAALGAVRQAFVNGYLDANPPTRDEIHDRFEGVDFF